jgi:hypothetical protein
MEIVLLTFAVAFGLSGATLAWMAIQGYRLYQGVRVVTCPETRAPVAVKLDAPRAATTRLAGNVDYRLTSCSRWPERRNCGQQCVSQIKAAPQACRVQSILAKSYRGAHCVLCGVDIEKIGRGVHKPVLMSPNRRTRTEWDEVAPQELPRILLTHSKICWNCHMAESFRTLRPEAALRSLAS